ncbi:alpha-D-ribose 1-methylphosphonate 5-triphosphate diphosphatase [Pseudoroseomonas globiformis]|uniref:Alpha-D-ribose 1-methylphosphonate 5-triphosphate diphosphatase n=1 Tax=Teichococcus globiformis TaxID=2307229 RepID=A0ABV7G339_9PROT
MTAWNISGGTVLVGSALQRRAEVLLRQQQICAEGNEADDAHRFDAAGLLVLPGVVDIHGDAQERQLQPRPGVSMPPLLAIRDSEAQLLAAGITTAFLGMTLSWEPGLRSVETWRQMHEALRRSAADRVCDIRVHLRFEIDNLEHVEEAIDAIARGDVHLLAFNDHTPGIRRKLGDSLKAAKYVERSGANLAELEAMADAALARRGDVEAARVRLADAARQAHLPMASHDDASVADRMIGRALGASICEFPMAEAVAQDARAAGEHVVMGAPNVLRGSSHLGWAAAAPLAEQGLVTILASDYVWPSLIQAAFVLEDRGTLSLPQAWHLISTNPARAAGLTDRGRIAPGQRADLVIVDPQLRRPVATFCAGRLAWLSAEGADRLGV